MFPLKAKKPGDVNPVETTIILKNVSDTEKRILAKGDWRPLGLVPLPLLRVLLLETRLLISSGLGAIEASNSGPNGRRRRIILKHVPALRSSTGHGFAAVLVRLLDQSPMFNPVSNVYHPCLGYAEMAVRLARLKDLSTKVSQRSHHNSFGLS